MSSSIETGSQKGKKLLSSGSLVDMDDKVAREKIEAFKQKAVQGIPLVHEVNEAMKRLKDGSADEGVWDYFGRKCIICGGCTFVCPTCTCFNVYDHERARGAASGHGPGMPAFMADSPVRRPVTTRDLPRPQG